MPIATFPELTAAEADAATGDIRKIAFALLDKLYDAWMGKAAADRPTKWTMDRQSSADDAAGTLTRTFVARFVTTAAIDPKRIEPTSRTSSRPIPSFGRPRR